MRSAVRVDRSTICRAPPRVSKLAVSWDRDNSAKRGKRIAEPEAGGGRGATTGTRVIWGMVVAGLSRWCARKLAMAAYPLGELPPPQFAASADSSFTSRVSARSSRRFQDDRSEPECAGPVSHAANSSGHTRASARLVSRLVSPKQAVHCEELSFSITLTAGLSAAFWAQFLPVRHGRFL